MINFYKNTSLNVWVLGETALSFSSPGQFYSVITGNYMALYNAVNNEKRHDSPYYEFCKENGEKYTSITELTTATAKYFSPSTGGGLENGFLIYTNQSNNLKIRSGVRENMYVIDKELTSTGFNGTEGTDWENITGNLL